jgi:GTP-binding protein Era
VSPETFKSGYVALIGRPNVGKSTLLNKLIDFDLSIVTKKPQTTRHAVLGVLHGEGFQIGFLDTPGLISGRSNRLDRSMRAAVYRSLTQADIQVLVVEPRMPGAVEKTLIEEISITNKTTLLVINKMDTVRKGRILPVIDTYSRLYHFAELLPMSALRDDGVALLVSLIAENLPEGPPIMEEDEFTDRSERFLVAEIIRKKIYERYHEELPYSTAVAIEQFESKGNGVGVTALISAVVYVERVGQRGILVGKQGASIREVGIEARVDIEELLGMKVYLEIWVRERADWKNDVNFIEEINYPSVE